MPLEQYLADLIRPLLTKPETAHIVNAVDDMGILLTLTLSPDDMGSVIGKDGQTAQAIRLLLRIAGIKQKAHVSLKITEPDGSSHVPKSEKAKN